MDRHCINYSVGQSISVTQIIHLINFCLINEYKWDLTMVLIEVPLTLHCIVLNKTRGIQMDQNGYLLIYDSCHDCSRVKQRTCDNGFEILMATNITIDAGLIRFHWSLLMLKFHCITRVLDSIEHFRVLRLYSFNSKLINIVTNYHSFICNNIFLLIYLLTIFLNY